MMGVLTVYLFIAHIAMTWGFLDDMKSFNFSISLSYNNKAIQPMILID